jgi:DNA repair protein RadC
MIYREIYRHVLIKQPKNIIDWLQKDSQYSGLSNLLGEMALFFLLGCPFYENTLTGIYQINGTYSGIEFRIADLLKEFEHHKYLTNVIMLHNHPQGSMIPSKEDLEATEKLNEYMEYGQVKLIYHILIGLEWEYKTIWSYKNEKNNTKK